MGQRSRPSDFFPSLKSTLDQRVGHTYKVDYKLVPKEGGKIGTVTSCVRTKCMPLKINIRGTKNDKILLLKATYLVSKLKNVSASCHRIAKL